MKKNIVKIWQKIGPPKLSGGSPNLVSYPSSLDGSAEEQSRRENEVEIQRAGLEMQREALRKTLGLSYASLVVAIFASVAAILAVAVTLFKHC